MVANFFASRKKVADELRKSSALPQPRSNILPTQYDYG